MPLLACDGLTRRPWFEARPLQLQAGEAVFLSGRTGAGKSLFLRALSDLDPADEVAGLRLDGRERTSFTAPEWRRQVLYLHQSAPRLAGTVADNLARIQELAYSNAPGETDAAPCPSVTEILASLGLSPTLEAERLSGGEAQLLAFARAFVTAPRVYLLDEATSALDQELALRVEALLAERLAAGCAILWVSHDPALAQRFGTSVEAFP